MAKRKMNKAKITAAAPSDAFDDKSWRTREDLRTLQSAHEISGDRARLAAAKAEAKRQQEALARVQRLEGKKL